MLTSETGSIPSKTYLIQTCDRLVEHFQKLVEQKKLQSDLTKENELLKMKLLSEQEKTENILKKINYDLNRFSNKQNEVISNNTQDSEQIIELKEKITSLNEKLFTIKMQYRELDTVMVQKSEKKIKDSLQMEKINHDLLNIKKKLQDQEARNTILKSSQENLKAKLNNLNSEIEKKQNVLQEKESQLSFSEKKHFEEINKECDSLSIFRKNLKENREKEILVTQQEKILDSLSEELESKTERLANIITSNKQLKTKIQKNDDIHLNYDLLNEQNAYLTEEINILKRKIECLPELFERKLEYLEGNLSSKDLKSEKEKKVNLNLKKERLEQEFQMKKSRQEEFEAENALLKERICDLTKELEEEDAKNQQLLSGYNKFKHAIATIEVKLQK